jgi:alkylation response protein AidB-like acyl-CoA dehydrogenase
MNNKWGLSAEDLAFQQQVRQYARTQLEPRAAQNDKDLRFDPAALPELIERNLLGVAIPTELGGQGKGYLQTALAVEEIARVDGSMAITLNAHYLAASLLNQFATPEQKQRFLVPLVREGVGALGMTEPNIGSDVASIETRAQRQPDGSYALTGKKRFITNANQARYWVVLAATDPAQKSRGQSIFVLDRETPGFTRGPIQDKMGMRGADWGTLVFENAQVPESSRIGNEGDGFKQAMFALDCGRVLVSAFSVGIAQGALDKALAYAKTRKQFDKPLFEHQDVQAKLAQMAADIEVCRGYVYQVAKMKDAGLPYSWEASVAKLQSAQMASRVTHDAVLLMGGNGYTKDYPVERYHRDAIAGEIVEGAPGIQKMIIARGLAKLPPDA